MMQSVGTHWFMTGKTPLLLAFVLNTLWINASEVFRYFALVMPMMRDAFPMVLDVAPMDLATFLIWAVWDTILVCVATLFPFVLLRSRGGSFRVAVLAGSSVWLGVFGLLWLGLFNMNLATPQILLAALPLAWLEMTVAAIIVWWICFRRRPFQ